MRPVFRTRLAAILLLTALTACPAPISEGQNPVSGNPAPVNPAQPPAAPQPAPPPEDFLSSATLEFPADFMKSVKEYGAKGDGVTDDTAAIRAALGDARVDGSGNALFPPAEFNGRPKALYFPAGTYLVSNTLKWVGCCVNLQGQGSAKTIIKLKAASSGFGNPSSPKPVLQTENGNESFRQNIHDLQILVGSGNPGAVALDYISNNSGVVENVLLKSEDGTGVSGLEMTRNWPGPNMFKNLVIDGFDYGIRVQFIEYSQTYENILLKNQRVAGIKNDGAVMAIRNLQSRNSVPAILNDGYGQGLITLLDSKLEGGTGGSAIRTASGKAAFVYLRNVTSSGYESVVSDDGKAIPGSSQPEWYSSAKSYSLFGTPTPAMLKLPIRNTPTFLDNDPVNWARVDCTGYNNCQVITQLQAALNSGKSTVYFPAGVRLVFDELTVTVPASVKRIIGFHGVFNTDARGVNGGGIRFVVADDSPEPLILEQFGYGVKLEHRGKRPVALKNIFLYEYKALPGAGDVYAEDAQIDGFTVQASQRFWGRQVNNELRTRTKITNNGGTVWIMGMKTEGQQTVIDAIGGQTEYLGGLLYPATGDMPPGEIAFKLSAGAKASLLYSNIVYTTRNYDTQVRESRGSDTKSLETVGAPERTRLFNTR